jgi:hypothetical protein
MGQNGRDDLLFVILCSDFAYCAKAQDVFRKVV